MSIVGTLIDKARARSGITSDNQLAAHFGVNRQAVSKWRTGDAYPDEENIVHMAQMAGDDPVEWLVAVKAIRSEGSAGKAWTSLAKRIGAVTALVLCAIGFSLPMAGTADATRNADPMASGDVQGNAYYVKADWAWWARLVSWWLAWKLRGSRSTPWRPMACNAA